MTELAQEHTSAIGIPLYNSTDEETHIVAPHAKINYVYLFSTADTNTAPYSSYTESSDADSETDYYDITESVTSLEITESINSLCLVGSVSISDSWNFFQDARIHGQERIAVSIVPYDISTKAYKDPFVLEFLVTNVSGFTRLEFKTLFTLEFASPHIYRDKTKRVGRAYGFTSISTASNSIDGSTDAISSWKEKYGAYEYPEEYIKDIIEKDLGVDSEKIQLLNGVDYSSSSSSSDNDSTTTTTDDSKTSGNSVDTEKEADGKSSSESGSSSKSLKTATSTKNTSSGNSVQQEVRDSDDPKSSSASKSTTFSDGSSVASDSDGNIYYVDTDGLAHKTTKGSDGKNYWDENSETVDAASLTSNTSSTTKDSNSSGNTGYSSNIVETAASGNLFSSLFGGDSSSASGTDESSESSSASTENRLTQKMQVVIPNWRPFQAIKWLLRNTFTVNSSGNGLPWFCYETIKVSDDLSNGIIKIHDYSKLITGESVNVELPEKYIFSKNFVPDADTEEYFDNLRTKIVDLQMTFSFDQYTKAANGSYATYEQYIDVASKYYFPNSNNNICESRIVFDSESGFDHSDSSSFLREYYPYARNVASDAVNLKNTNYTYFIAYNSALYGEVDSSYPYNQAFGLPDNMVSVSYGSAITGDGGSYGSGGSGGSGNYTYGSGGSGINPGPSGQASYLIESNYTKTANAVGITKQQWDIYRRTMAYIESPSYSTIGGDNNHFDGAYQFGGPARRGTAKQLGVATPSRTAFRNNPNMQEQFFDQFTYSNHRTLMRYSQKYKSMSAIEKMGVLGYSHNQGAGGRAGNGGAADWLRTGVVGADAFHTPGTKYYNAVVGNLQANSGGGSTSAGTSADPNQTEVAAESTSKTSGTETTTSKTTNNPSGLTSSGTDTSTSGSEENTGTIDNCSSSTSSETATSSSSSSSNPNDNESGNDSGSGSSSNIGSSNDSSGPTGGGDAVDPTQIGKVGRTGDMVRSNMNFMQHVMRVMGDFNITPGAIVNIEVQKAIDPQLYQDITNSRDSISGDYIIDEFISGKYFVTECTHVFANLTFETFATLNSDSAFLSLDGSSSKGSSSAEDCPKSSEASNSASSSSTDGTESSNVSESEENIVDTEAESGNNQKTSTTGSGTSKSSATSSVSSSAAKDGSASNEGDVIPHNTDGTQTTKGKSSVKNETYHHITIDDVVWLSPSAQKDQGRTDSKSTTKETDNGFHLSIDDVY